MPTSATSCGSRMESGDMYSSQGKPPLSPGRLHMPPWLRGSERPVKSHHTSAQYSTEE